MSWLFAVGVMAWLLATGWVWQWLVGWWAFLPGIATGVLTAKALFWWLTRRSR